MPYGFRSSTYVFNFNRITVKAAIFMKTAPDKALHKGMEAHQNGNLQKAYHYYNIVLKANPEHPDANHKMACSQLMLTSSTSHYPSSKKL